MRLLLQSSLILLLLILSGCSRPTSSPSDLRITMPDLSHKVQSKVDRLAVPENVVSVGSINCFAVMVGGPDPVLKANHCSLIHSDASMHKVHFGPWNALSAVGDEISLVVPSGNDRVIHLFGGIAGPGECVDLRIKHSPDISKLRHLASKKFNLAPGPQKVSLTVPPSVSARPELELSQCEIKSFGASPTTNTPPQVVESCSLEAKERLTYNCIPSVTDPDFGDSHTWSFASTNTCSWANIDTDSGVISGQPVATDIGPCDLDFFVTDGKDASATTSLPLNVAPFALSPSSYIKASNPSPGDAFGEKLAISGDTLVVGAPYEDSNQTTITNGGSASSDDSLFNAGAAYVYVRDAASGWSPQAYLKASNADSDDWFGHQVAVDGDTVIVSAPDESSSQTGITNGVTSSADNSSVSSGAVYVYTRSGTSWSQQAYLKASNNGSEDKFGSRIAISGDTIAVGAHLEDSSQTNITNGSTASADDSAADAGAVYIFKRSGGSWSQEAYLKAPNAEAGDKFGFDLDLSGDTLVVGASYEDSDQTTITNGSVISGSNSAISAGAAYVYRRSGTLWSFESYLKASNADGYDRFGYSVAIDKDTIAVGAHMEDSSDTTVTNGSSASSDNSLTESGAVYVYTRNGTNWSPQAYLKAPNSRSNLQFGMQVDISGNLIIVGAEKDSSNSTITLNDGTASTDTSATHTGAAYVFSRHGSTWSFVSYVKAPNAEASDFFGRSVAVDNGTFVIGADGEDSNQNTINNDGTFSSDNSLGASGAVYVFE